MAATSVTEGGRARRTAVLVALAGGGEVAPPYVHDG